MVSSGFFPPPSACFCGAATPITVISVPSRRICCPTGSSPLGNSVAAVSWPITADGRAMLFIRLVEPAAEIEIEIEDPRNRRRISLQDYVLGPHVAAPHVRRTRAQFRMKNSQRRRRRFHVRQLRKVLCPFALELLALQHFRREPSQSGPGKSVANDDVRTEALHRTKHVRVEPRNDGADGDHRTHADHNPEHREKRSQGIPAQSIDRQNHRLAHMPDFLIALHFTQLRTLAAASPPRITLIPTAAPQPD